MSTTDNFTSTCFQQTKNEKNSSANAKNTSETNEKKRQNKKKENNENSNRNNSNENRNNQSKLNIYILGDSMIKKLNGYLLTRKIKHKHLVKVRSFSRAKISCMTDHVKTFQSLKLQILSFFQARSSLIFRQIKSGDSL